jgi:hypothetical protein
MRIARLAATAALAAVALTPLGAGAQQSKPEAGGAPGAYHPAPPGPYKPVAVTLPKPYGDASLDAFRKELGDIANRKDRAALATKVVTKGFFWQREDSDGADPKKSGIDNLADAIGLDSPDGTGWQALAAYAQDATAAAQPELKNMICSPAFPSFNENAMEELSKQTKTDPSEWSYPTSAGIEVRAKPNASAPVVDKLGVTLVRLLIDNSSDAASAEWIKIVTPSGKVGFVPASALAPLGSDQICYAKEGGGWRIAGYVGGGGGQE